MPSESRLFLSLRLTFSAAAMFHRGARAMIDDIEFNSDMGAGMRAR